MAWAPVISTHSRALGRAGAARVPAYLSPRVGWRLLLEEDSLGGVTGTVRADGIQGPGQPPVLGRVTGSRGGVENVVLDFLYEGDRERQRFVGRQISEHQLRGHVTGFDNVITFSRPAHQ